MSYEASLYIVVEGKVHDPFFYDTICRSSKAISSAGHEIRLISQIRIDEATPAAGGKEAVIDFYKYCKTRGKLVQHNAKGKRCLAFAVDRDTQHITGGMKRSPHVIYTVYADVEAHIFAESHQEEALAGSASLDRATADDLVRSIGDWRRDLADHWRPWIELCYTAEAVRANCWVGFGQAQSRIHKGTRFRSIDAAQLKKAEDAIRAHSPLSSTEFSEVQDKVLAKLREVYDRGRQASLLKGKWLPVQLTFYVEDYFHGISWSPDPWHMRNFKEAITRCYALNLQVDAPGISAIRSRLEALV